MSEVLLADSPVARWAGWSWDERQDGLATALVVLSDSAQQRSPSRGACIFRR